MKTLNFREILNTETKLARAARILAGIAKADYDGEVSYCIHELDQDAKGKSFLCVTRGWDSKYANRCLYHFFDPYATAIRPTLIDHIESELRTFFSCAQSTFFGASVTSSVGVYPDPKTAAGSLLTSDRALIFNWCRLAAYVAVAKTCLTPEGRSSILEAYGDQYAHDPISPAVKASLDWIRHNLIGKSWFKYPLWSASDNPDLFSGSWITSVGSLEVGQRQLPDRWEGNNVWCMCVRYVLYWMQILFPELFHSAEHELACPDWVTDPLHYNDRAEQWGTDPLGYIPTLCDAVVRYSEAHYGVTDNSTDMEDN